MPSELDIELVMRSLTNISSECTPSEAHGILCGLLCAKEKIEVNEWISHLSKGLSPGDLLAAEAYELLALLYNETMTSLTDNDLKFYPLLPEDEAVMVSLEGIAQWAQGFLMGLSLAGIQEFSNYPEEVEEFVEAMVSISDADSYDLADDESDEEAVFELIEFIRMGVLLVNEEMNPIRVPVDLQETDAQTQIH
ncbi:MAG: YecA family protein [Proteobacteria bacterium]|nr:YecA family protein [Pseudomonadota bacterium]